MKTDVFTAGFRLGVEKLPVDSALAKLASDWNGMTASHHHKCEKRIAELSVRAKALEERELPEVETNFARVQEAIGDCPAPAGACLLVLLALFLTLIDSYLVAPSFELLFNLRSEQLVAAIVLVAVSTVILHACWHGVKSEKTGHQVLAITGAVFVGAFLTTMGMMRARIAMAHDAEALFYVLATLATPIGGAWCSLNGVARLSAARKWRMAEQKLEGVRAESDAVQRDMEKTKVQQARGAEEIAARREAQKHALQMGYEAGGKGVEQEPLAHVILKAAAAAAVVLIFGMVPHCPIELLIAATGVVGALALVLFNTRRNHPNDGKLAKQRRIAFQKSGGEQK